MTVRSNGLVAFFPEVMRPEAIYLRLGDVAPCAEARPGISATSNSVHGSENAGLSSLTKGAVARCRRGSAFSPTLFGRFGWFGSWRCLVLCLFLAMVRPAIG